MASHLFWVQGIRSSTLLSVICPDGVMVAQEILVLLAGVRLPFGVLSGASFNGRKPDLHSGNGSSILPASNLGIVTQWSE